MPEMEERAEAEAGRRFSQRVAAARAKAAALASTRAAIFREELSDKGASAARAIGGFVAAAFFGAFALLLATALLAALLSKLLGGAIAGVAATLVLYLIIAAAGAMLGARALDRIKPLDFPATSTELRRDFDALAAAAAPPPEEDDDGAEADLEERYRSGAE
jgi:hypothetical protein